jgi:RimJ/RimL family protein N-acetyltransferase
VGGDPSRGEVGFWIGEPFHGHGYMTEAARSALSAGFDRLGLALIQGGAQPENLASLAVMRRLAMEPAGERTVFVPARNRLERCVFFEVARERFLNSLHGT